MKVTSYTNKYIFNILLNFKYLLIIRHDVGDLINVEIVVIKWENRYTIYIILDIIYI